MYIFITPPPPHPFTFSMGRKPSFYILINFFLYHVGKSYLITRWANMSIYHIKPIFHPSMHIYPHIKVVLHRPCSDRRNIFAFLHIILWGWHYNFVHIFAFSHVTHTVYCEDVIVILLFCLCFTIIIFIKKKEKVICYNVRAIFHLLFSLNSNLIIAFIFPFL